MRSIILDVYCDEINNVKFNFDNSIWMYIGILFVPKLLKIDLFNELSNYRCITNNKWDYDNNNCSLKCRFHDSNNTEIHYKEINRSHSRYLISKRWLKDFLIEKNNRVEANKKLVYFNILGLNLSNMNLQTFGNDKSNDLTIYNRFFRTTLISGAKYFFNHYDNIIIDNIFHDKGSQEFHKLFPWYTSYKIDLDPYSKIIVNNKDIIFIDSDHRKYHLNSTNMIESQYIQFIDLIMGSIYCCIHYPSTNPQKIEIGLIMKPLVERLINKPNNKNSSYNYYRRQKISFFPKNKIENINEVNNQLDLYNNSVDIKIKNFYTQRKILILPINQQKLDDFS